MPKRLLITGVSGLLGSNLAHILKDDHAVLGVYYTREIMMDGVTTRAVDLRVPADVKKVVQDFIPDVVIHCAAAANVDVCEEEQDGATAANVDATRNIVGALAGSKVKLVYISTDLVYDGVKGVFSETDAPGPRNHYARTKLEAEKEALRHPGALVLRTNFFGWSPFVKRSIAEWAMDKLGAGEVINGFDDAVFSSIYTFDLAAIIRQMIKKDLFGVYNAASRTSLSKYDFLVKLARGAGLDGSLIKRAKIVDARLKAERSKNLSLDVTKLAEDTGLIIPTIEEGIEHFIQDIPQRYAERLAGGDMYYPLLDMVPYGRQAVDEDDIAAVVDVLKSSNLTQGPKVELFEKAVVETVGAPFCTAVNSGTSALHMACLAAGIRQGDEVVTSPNTFVASANCALYCCATPVFADIDPRTHNISPLEVERKITAKTRAVIPVHFAGQSCDMAALSGIVKKAEKKFGKKIFIIEDASHALGSSYREAKVGACALSDMAVLSFHPVKHITTGEGGAVLTRDRELYRQLYRLRSHGITSTPDELEDREAGFEISFDGKSERRPWYYEQVQLGYNYRITDIQCALGIAQLKKLDGFRARRRKIVTVYNKAFLGLEGLQVPFEAPEGQANFHLYVVLIDFARLKKTRTALMQELRNKGIGTQVHYIPVYRQPYYRRVLKIDSADYPETEAYYARCLSLPLFPAMKDRDVEKVIAAVKGAM